VPHRPIALLVADPLGETEDPDQPPALASQPQAGGIAGLGWRSGGTGLACARLFGCVYILVWPGRLAGRHRQGSWRTLWMTPIMPSAAAVPSMSG
jgi:hypothetical protein